MKWTYFYLYVMLDIFSRHVVGWMVAQRENTNLAKRLIRESCDKEGIEPEQLTIHADRGSPMKAKTTGQLLADLGVTKSHSRPHVSNDNPFSESHFKTFKYRPGFPDRFGCQQDALSGITRTIATAQSRCSRLRWSIVAKPRWSLNSGTRWSSPPIMCTLDF